MLTQHILSVCSDTSSAAQVQLVDWGLIDAKLLSCWFLTGLIGSCGSFRVHMVPVYGPCRVVRSDPCQTVRGQFDDEHVVKEENRKQDLLTFKLYIFELMQNGPLPINPFFHPCSPVRFVWFYVLFRCPTSEPIRASLQTPPPPWSPWFLCVPLCFCRSDLCAVLFPSPLYSLSSNSVWWVNAADCRHLFCRLIGCRGYSVFVFSDWGADLCRKQPQLRVFWETACRKPDVAVGYWGRLQPQYLWGHMFMWNSVNKSRVSVCLKQSIRICSWQMSNIFQTMPYSCIQIMFTEHRESSHKIILPHTAHRVLT